MQSFEYNLSLSTFYSWEKYVDKSSHTHNSIASGSVWFSHSVMSDSLWSPGLQHSRRPCPSPTPGACSNSCPSPRWCQASEWLDLNTHTGSWPPVSPAPLTPVSPLPPVHSTCVFITPDFFVTRKMKKKANPSDNEGIRVQYKLLRFSYFMCRATIWSVQVPNFLNLRQKWKKKKKTASSKTL